MAEKDILEKVLMAHSDVFADCENALVYGGRKRLSAEEICPAPTESFYRGKDRIHREEHTGRSWNPAGRCTL